MNPVATLYKLKPRQRGEKKSMDRSDKGLRSLFEASRSSKVLCAKKKESGSFKPSRFQITQLLKV